MNAKHSQVALVDISLLPIFGHFGFVQLPGFNLRCILNRIVLRLSGVPKNHSIFIGT